MFFTVSFRSTIKNLYYIGLIATNLIAASGQVSQSNGENRRDVAAIQRDLLLLFQGEDPIRVKASPMLCHPGAAFHEREDMDIRHWYFGDDGCYLKYPSNLTSVVTPVSEGISKKLYDSPAS